MNRSDGGVLDRRFEAFVFDWDGTAVPDRRADATPVRERVEELCAVGADVYVVSGTHVGNVDGQLGARPDGPGRLHLCLNRGSEVFSVDPDGPEVVYRRTASTEEEGALDRAAALAVRRLAEYGLRAEIVSSRLNRRKIDLIPEPEWADPPKADIDSLLLAVEERLRSAGLSGLRDVVALAAEAARESGLPDPRVTSDAKHVEIGLTDKSDSARWIFEDLWRRGIAPRLVLIAGDEFGPLGGLPGSDSLMLTPEAATASVISVGVEPEGVPSGVFALGGGPDAFLAVLDDQILRRAHREVPSVDAIPEWTLSIRGFDAERERVDEALLTLADGVIGTSGSPPARHRSATPAVRVAGLYVGDGPETELARAPVWNDLGFDMEPDVGLHRTLDFRTGVVRQELVAPEGTVQTFAFSSLARPGVAVMRAQGPAALLKDDRVLWAPAGSNVTEKEIDGRTVMGVAAPSGGVVAVGSQTRDDERTPIVGIERLAAYHVDGARPDSNAAIARVREAERDGFEILLAEHRRAWARRWEDADIVVEGDTELQAAIRFALFHLMSSVADIGEAAVGARGLSGPGYRGHVFWDADVFVLPFLAATHPAAARAMLEYRIARLPAAMAAARAIGRAGARFPWESARDGSDVTPSMGRDPAGHVFPIRTAQLEEHIVADVAWAADHYLAWTGDAEFRDGPRRKLLVETARYWASRVRVTPDGRAHLFGVCGPDEYHEPVDDNAFTNVMARWNLRRAAEAVAASPGSVPNDEATRWLEIADLLVDNYDENSGLYEQFAGFWDLEPLVIADVAPRRPIAAELLLGRDRVRAAQVIKQADVLMLHHIVPGEVAPGSLLPNLDFYEPRTAHGSSLSPGVHAALFARAGRLTDALRALHIASRIDLDDLTGTSASGLHIATMGSVWQAMAFGFAGLRPAGDVLQVDPHIPPMWDRLEIRVRFHGSCVRLNAEPASATITADPPIDVRLDVDGPVVSAGPDGVRLNRVGERWKAGEP